MDELGRLDLLTAHILLIGMGLWRWRGRKAQETECQVRWRVTASFGPATFEFA